MVGKERFQKKLQHCRLPLETCSLPLIWRGIGGCDWTTGSWGIRPITGPRRVWPLYA
jgi:hypothetical protein